MERGRGEKGEFGRLPETGEGRNVDALPTTQEIPIVPNKDNMGGLGPAPEHQLSQPTSAPSETGSVVGDQPFTPVDLARDVPPDGLSDFEQRVISSMEQ